MFWLPLPQFVTIEKLMPATEAWVLFCTFFVTSK
jgi:hypothetical protein